MKSSHFYQIGFLGQSNGLDVIIERLIKVHFNELGVSSENLIFFDEKTIKNHDRKLPVSVVFFGYKGADNSKHSILKTLIDDAIFILPVVDDLDDFSENVPELLIGINGCKNDDHERITSTLLENFCLLRPERRLFISYKRSEAQSIAIQLYEKLESAGFDVFLDTHSVSVGEDFQGALWHRLADSDIMILLDTPEFRTSKWTQEELAKANTTNIQILHLLWPDIKEDQESAFSEFLSLTSDNFCDDHQLDRLSQLTEAVIDNVVIKAENLRARALAARHRYLVDNLLDQTKQLNISATIQAERFISIEIEKDKYIAVVPAVGVPNAERYEKIEKKLLRASIGTTYSKVWLLYDERGVMGYWLDHLEWLNSHLPLRSVKITDSENKMAQEIL